MIISCTGIDAAGKATQVRLLTERLHREGLHAESCDFPSYQTLTGKAIGQLLRQEWGVKMVEDDLKGTRAKELQALTLQALMTCNRLEKARWLQRFAGSQTWNMVLDRYTESGLAYGAADGLPMEWLVEIHSTLPCPDLWILVDIPAEESVKRRPVRRDEYETRSGFLEKVRDGYLRLFEMGRTGVLAEMGLPHSRWEIVDGMGTVEEVHDRLWCLVRNMLALSK